MGRHSDKQRPSTPAIELHVLGTAQLSDEMSESGAQNPALAPLPHGASRACCAGGISAAGKQCAPAQVGEQPSSLFGSTTAGLVHPQVRMTGLRLGSG